MWVDPYENAQVVREQLSELLGRDAERGAWAIVDQVGLGPAMVTETPAAQELRSETIATFGPQDEDDSTTLDLLPK
jgi:hypothetical protein